MANLVRMVLAAVLLLSFSGVCLAEPPRSSVPLGSKIIAGDNSTLWLSPNSTFAFGFLGDFQKDGGLVVGIWHNFPGAVVNVPVWTVGGGVRVTQNSFFQLSLDGSLQLFDSSPLDLLIWSSNTGSSGVRSVQLMDDGNLVLIGNEGEFLWQSFDSPTNTLLPGQPLRFPHSLRAPSVKSTASYYSLKVTRYGDVSLLWESNVTYWSSHLNSYYNGDGGIVEARLDADGLFGLFEGNGTAVWYKLSEDYKDLSVQFRRLTIDSDGNLRLYSWDNVSSSWKLGWQAVQNQCDVFGSCGLYSVCGYNSTGPVCDCLSELDSVSGQCEKMADLNNCQSQLSMATRKQTVLYSLYPPHDVDVKLSMEKCRDYCLNDASCYAATAMNDGSGSCTIKRSSFVSGYHYSSVHAISFVKICLVPEAVSAQVANLHGGASPLQQSSELIKEHKNFTATTAVVLLITAFVFLTVEALIFWFIMYRRKQISSRRRAKFRKDLQMNPHYSAVVRLSFDEVKELTRNFTSKLGPSLYKGILPNKVPVTVRKLDNVLVSERDFRAMISNLGSTHHKNLVALKGFCFDSQHKFLLYEYISDCALDQWLLDKKNKNKGRDSWQNRLNIAMGIARGLAYLHLECKQCIAHGALNLENVLLDESLVPKLTNFGIHSLLTKTVPSTSETLPERDICMFGELLLQMVAGKREGTAGNLRDSAYDMCRNGALCDFVDVHLEGNAEDGVERVVKLALWCIRDDPALRPSIGEVVMVIEGALSLDMPPTPHTSITLPEGN